MFGTSGIRGVYGKDITEGLAERVACLFAQERLVIGRDIRKSGPSLLKAAEEGALAAGADVIDLGIAPTPTTALATRRFSCRGIMLTASHNPPEYNGLKLIESTKEIGKRMEKEIERAYKENLPRSAKPRDGNIYRDSSVIQDHKAMILGMVDVDAIRKRKPKVIVDCNGAGSVITPYLLTDLGCKVISVNSSAECFNRPSEPSGASIAYLSGLVVESNADFAIAHDGDADRCMVIDDKGEQLPLDVQLAMMISHELKLARKGDRRVISTVEASLAIRDVVENAGGVIDITPVGSAFIADLMEGNNAFFGGEPCGEYIYREGVHVPDAILGAAKFAEIFCNEGAFSKLKTRYPQNFMARERFPADDKARAMERVKEAIQGLGIEGKTRTDDGIRIDEEDGWVLIRASGTEPIIRLTMEYKAKEKLEKRKKELGGLIKKYL